MCVGVVSHAFRSQKVYKFECLSLIVKHQSIIILALCCMYAALLYMYMQRGSLILVRLLGIAMYVHCCNVLSAVGRLTGFACD
jgi:hypothetical protein